MKGLPRSRYSLGGLVFLCLLGLRVMSFDSAKASPIPQNVTTAPELLALKEGELISFVNAVQSNSLNCGALSACSSTVGCSRLSCYMYATPGYNGYSCLPVANNTFCSVAQTAPVCMQRNFDYNEGFVRRVDSAGNHVARTVCAQKSLDIDFKNSTMSDTSHFFRVFFGAVDGTFRIYPGADEGCDDSYDPRLRPWYLASTFVPKVVTVLIDTGLNMRTQISGTDSQTYIGRAIATALALLDTLEEGQDYVSFACFDGDGIKQLGNTSIYNSNPMKQALNDSLTAVVASPSKSDPDSNDTNVAINATINRLVQQTSSNAIPGKFLKVVIALVGGEQYDDISELTVAAVPTINLFVYSFRKSLQPQCSTALRASLEEVPFDRLSNSLYALQSFYSFLAKLHISFINKNGQLSDFGQQYPDFSGVDKHTLTLSKAAFDPSTGEFLGVVGIDFYQNLVDKQFPTIPFDSIVEEARKHDPPGIFDTSVDLSTNVCFNHTDTCEVAASSLSGFLCAMTNSDINIGCCGSCEAVSSHHKKKKHIVTIALSVVGGVLAFVAIVIGGMCLYWRCRGGRQHGDRRRDDIPVPAFGAPAPNDGNIPQPPLGAQAPNGGNIPEPPFGAQAPKGGNIPEPPFGAQAQNGGPIVSPGRSDRIEGVGGEPQGQVTMELIHRVSGLGRRLCQCKIRSFQDHSLTFDRFTDKESSCGELGWSDFQFRGNDIRKACECPRLCWKFVLAASTFLPRV